MDYPHIIYSSESNEKKEFKIDVDSIMTLFKIRTFIYINKNT